MVALVHPVFDCLMRLAQPDSLVNEEEVWKSYLSFCYLHFLKMLFLHNLFHVKLLQYVIHENLLVLPYFKYLGAIS